jgi:HPt (histidine-containing phosphotransfer) domain-containing protein
MAFEARQYTQEQIDSKTFDEMRLLTGERFSVILQSFCESAEAHLVAIRAALESNSPQDIRDAAHPLRTISGQLGFTGMAHMAGALEDAANEGRIDERTKKTGQAIREEYEAVKSYIADYL